MKIQPNVFPFIERIKNEPDPDARVEIAVAYIDNTIKLFEKFSFNMSGRALLRYFKNCKSHWEKLVRLEIPMSEPDEDGEVGFLMSEMYESIFAQRALMLPPDEEKRNQLIEALTGIYIHFGWSLETLNEAKEI